MFVILNSDIESFRMQYLNNLDYNLKLNEDGSANVTEIWDIDVNNTNTLFKTFKLDNKYSGIENVHVKEITQGNEKDFKQIYEVQYHVDRNCYYALNTSRNEFEIAWGIGMDTQYGKRKYEISYVIKDIITDYKDCQEFYWQFLGLGENTIQAKHVTGTVTLPKNVENMESLKVWGHGQLNGEINKVSNNQVKFNINNLSKGARLEIRVVTEEKMFSVNNSKKMNYNILPNIINEETRMGKFSKYN